MSGESTSLQRSAVSRWRAVVVLMGGLLLSSCGSAAGDRQSDVATVGVLRTVPTEVHDIFLDEFRAQGWIPGRNLRILPADAEQVFATAADARDALRAWEDDGLDLVVAFSTPYALLVAEETDLPGLFVVNDPVVGGLTSDLRRPDGDLTGIRWRAPADRTLDVGAEVLGEITNVGYLWPIDDPAVAGHRAQVVEATDELGLTFTEASFSGPRDIPGAVAKLAAAEVDAVYLPSTSGIVAAVDQLEVELDRHGLPVLANIPLIDFAVVTLEPDSAELHRQLARQASRLLNGSPVASVPGEDPRRFLVTINATQAESLGYVVDRQVLRQADTVR